ncbi:MAG: hypothetical protein IPM38_01090 [Ignavibacteria bacterium]|nr:hypothetical protein [Ignavibacteria bacterium]
MNKIITVYVILLTFVSIGYTQESTTYELKIQNFSTDSLKIDVYPIGTIFNGDKLYSLKCKNPRELYYKFIFGGSKYLNNNYNTFDLNHDANNYYGTCESSISYGKYRIRFSIYNTVNEEFDSLDYCDVDYSDSDYPYQNHNDIILKYFNADSITFSFLSTFYNIIEAGRYLKIWDQFGGSFNKTLNKNGFISDSSYLYIPINAVDSMAQAHLNFGDIFINFSLSDDMSTRNILIDTVTNITVKKRAALIINSGKTFEMITPSFGYNNLIVEDKATLVLNSNGKTIVNSPNKITLKNKSNLTMHNNAEIRIKNGGVLCNEGGIIRGPGKITFDSGVHVLCSDIVNDFAVRDSAKIVLEDSAVVILPDNYTLHLRGNTTSLVMKPGSKMMFGENSGIVCDSGAKVIANNAIFTSADSTKKWNGISLKHRSQDTIKNCVIKNADFGINIMNKNDDEETEIPYSTEISGCSFINQTSHVLNNGIYAAGSSKLLISNNV